MSPADVPSIFAVVFLSCISSYSFLEFPSLHLHCPSVVLCHLLCASASWLVVICFRFPVWESGLAVMLAFYFSFQYWGLNSGSTPWATLPALFCDGFFSR
jgi:hypothetical protein